MITEKDLETTKFFTTDGSDILEVTKTQTVHQVFLTDLKTKRDYCCQVDCETSRMFTPIVMPNTKPVEAAKTKEASKKAKGKRKKPASSIKDRVSRIEDPASSRTFKHKGVVVRQSKTKGTRYIAQPFDKTTGKQVTLGTFDSGYLAAATVESYFGHEETAQRLRDQAEQAENNPDRPKSTRAKKIKPARSSAAAAAKNAERAPVGKAFECTCCYAHTQLLPIMCLKCENTEFELKEKRENENRGT